MPRKSDSGKGSGKGVRAYGGPPGLSRPFTLVAGCDKDDPVLKDIMENDLKGLDTPLKLMKRYAEVINKGTSYGDIAEKLDRLFLCGRLPVTLDGFYHGITLGLKSGFVSQGILDKIRSALPGNIDIDPLQIFYGRLLSKTSPWAGKNFKVIGGKKLSELTGGLDKGKKTAYLGINSFRKDRNSIINNIAGHLLSTIIDMEEVPAAKEGQRSWIYAKGGLFIASTQTSVGPENQGREVVALNYRWKSLGNELPNKLLIDEIVEIAEGLYLGKLYYATSLTYMLKDFDPRVEVKDYDYRNFGYFLLMDDSWLQEKNTLFPDLTYKLSDDLEEKFTTFRLTETGKCKTVAKKPTGGKTVLHYLQGLSMGVKEGTDSEEKFFDKMHELFMCGQRPDGINGFLHGGVVAFRRGGFFKKLGTNILNDLWPAVRPFSPWTGKTFTKSSVDGIRRYIGDSANYYIGKGEVIVGTNTYRKDLDLSLPATAFIERLDSTGMVVEYPDELEKEEGIYVKSFYFIANYGKSVYPGSEGKEVLQFNYRWPAFHTMPPDCLCIDELVRIADGLYLGQLLYSLRPEVAYTPEKDPAAYEYENFGYFMLMDDEWFAIKEFIDFDTE